MKRLANQNAIVTGAAQGMGFAIAEALCMAGAGVAVCDINKEALQSAAEKLKRHDTPVAFKPVDVRNKNEVFKFVQETATDFGSVDILVNNAGGALHTPHLLDEIEETHWNLVMDVNLKGAFFFCQSVISIMAEQGGGSIINMSALAGHWRASLAGVQYTAAKAGVEGLTRQLAYDWGKAGIRVNAIAPTVTITGERIQSLWDSKTDAEQKKVLAAIPLGRLSTPDEVASVVIFLASNESSYLTGTTIDVSGGRYLR
jgi:NAD(P)-dependent dehydrogenase (short-subunit alcohol dehydrogenase family)